MNKRIDYIDYMKGIGILLVMLQHSIQDNYQPLDRFILSFHMPLFFVTGGLLMGLRKSYDEKMFTFIKNKTYSFVFPIIVMGTLNLITEVGVRVFNHTELTLDLLKTYLQWFLPVYFIMEIFLFAFKSYVRRPGYKILTLAIVGTLSFVVGDIPIIKQSLCAIVFGMAGLLIGEKIEKNQDDEITRNKKWGGYSVYVIPLLALLAHINEPISMANNVYGNMLMFYVAGFLGTYVVYDIATVIRQSRLISFFGRNSIIFYSTHFFTLSMLGIFFRRVVNAQFEFSEYPWFMILYFITLVVETALVRFVEKHAAWLFGRKVSGNRNFM